VTEEPVTVAVVELKVEATYLQLSREARAAHWLAMQKIIAAPPTPVSALFGTTRTR
jgi:hypothetical protein